MDINKDNSNLAPQPIGYIQQQPPLHSSSNIIQYSRQRSLNPMALQTPPILSSSYNNGGGGAITPPPDPANSRSSGVKQLPPQQPSSQPPTTLSQQQHQRIAPAPAPNTFVNVSNLAGMSGIPLNMNLVQCCPVPLQQQQQFIINDNGNGISNPKLISQLQSKASNLSCDQNPTNVGAAAANNNVATAPPIAANRPLMQPTSERPESIVFLYHIPNDPKIYLVKCVEVSQLLDIDVRGMSGGKQPQKNIKHHLEQHLAQRFQPSSHPHPPSQPHPQPHPHPSTLLQSQPQQQFSQQQPQQQFSQQQPNPYQFQQQALHSLQQLRHHPYQQRLSPKSTLQNTSIGKNIKTPGSSSICTTNNIPSANLHNITEGNNNNDNNAVGNVIDQTADLQQFSVEMNQNTGNFDLMLPMTAGTAPGAYMVTPSATPTMRNDQLITDFTANYLAQQQAMLNAQPQHIFTGFDKNGTAN